MTLRIPAGLVPSRKPKLGSSAPVRIRTNKRARPTFKGRLALREHSLVNLSQSSLPISRRTPDCEYRAWIWRETGRPDVEPPEIVRLEEHGQGRQDEPCLSMGRPYGVINPR